MAVEFALPELGENVEKGDVVRVLVKPGDVVKKDQPVLELETDKATIEVPSNVAGKVTDIRVKAGDRVKVGQVVLVLDEAGGNGQPKEGQRAEGTGQRAEGKGQKEPGKKEPEEKKPEIKEPDRKEPEVREPPRKQPERAESAKKPAEVGSEAARTSAAAEDEDTPRPVPVRSARQADVVAFDAGRAAPAAKSEPARPAEAPPAPSSGEPIAAAPSVRRFARELGIDIAQITGTGPGGRIGQEDVKEHVKGFLTRGGGAAARPAAGLPDFSKWGEVEVKPMSGIRRKTAEHLSIAWQAPHVTQHDRADVTVLEQFRQSFGPRVEKAGGKLTVTAILIRLCAIAIDRFPQFASSVDMGNESIVYKKYRHIGVAVDTPNGLLVPVIRDANRKTITEIAVELAALSQKARDRKLSLDEMSGGVFSITNLGGIGGTSFTPIVNQPEVAILGVSRAAMEPVWRDNAFVPRQMLPLSLSYDHRVIDGADAARFLRFVAEALEQPLTMLL
jgi:pyruvate dehydrogenase E2 component (dihydrolipoamide acetyltransferase)